MKYTVILERETDGGFVASCPCYLGCISQGDSRDEAMANIREAIDLYIEDCLLAGDPVPQEDSRRLVWPGLVALERDDFVFQRQKGSHMILRREDPYSRVVVP